MPRHLSLDELKAGLPEILASPKDEGILRAHCHTACLGRAR